MRFLDSSQLLWAIAALLPVLLYLFRRRPRRVPVSSLTFFKSLAREHRESAWLRWLKRILSLLLTLMVIGGTVAALARLVVSPSAGEVRSVVVVIDRSASMGAKDERGETRLDAAIERVRGRIAGLSSGVAVMVLAFDRQTEVVVPKSYDRRSVERALDAMRVRQMEADHSQAMRLAQQFASLETPSAIWFASDGPATKEITDAAAKVESIAVPLEHPRNVGITAFDIRALPLESRQCEAFVQLHATGPANLEAKVEVRLDGALTALRELTLAPGSQESLLLPIDATSGRLLTVRALTSGDQLAEDNEVTARLPEPHTLKVLWVSPQPEPFTQLALTAISREGELAVFRAQPEAWPPKESVDAVIFQNWLPNEWPEGLPVVVIDPPGPRGPVQAARLEGKGIPVDRLRATRERHPLLYGVATARLILTQTAVLAAEGTLEPLWTGPVGPLLAAGDVHGQRMVVLGFAPDQSENLPLSASYPLLLGNAIHWVSQPKLESRGARIHHTGDNISLRGKQITWINAEGKEAAREPLRQGWSSLDRAGLWQTDGGDTGTAALLSPRETTLPAGATASSGETTHRPWLNGDLTTPLLLLVLIVLVAESWLFHRHAVH
jgi:hypothetical protein